MINMNRKIISNNRTFVGIQNFESFNSDRSDMFIARINNDYCNSVEPTPPRWGVGYKIAWTIN